MESKFRSRVGWWRVGGGWGGGKLKLCELCFRIEMESDIFNIGMFWFVA